MAIYHLTAKTVSRGESASAAVRSDYIERSGRYASDHAELLHKGHGNMPAWASDAPRNYWEAADAHERANGRLFKQLEFALPKELSPGQLTALAASFCRKMAQTKDGPLPYSFAVHKGHDKENPHCHLMISERVNDGVSRAPGLWFKRAAQAPAKGGAKKTVELRPREWLLQCRELWAERANHALRLAGHKVRIDHRTLEAQGIDRVPTTHLGPSVAALERQGIRTIRGNRNRQREEDVLEAVKEKWAAKIDALRAEKLPRQKLFALVKLARTHEAEELEKIWHDLALSARAQQHVPASSPQEKKPEVKPAPVPTVEECQAVLLAIAKQEPTPKVESYYQEQIKPYLEYFSEADDKAEAFAFCREHMQADVTTEASRLKEMSRELSERLRRFGGTGSQQIALEQEAMNHIRLAPDREQAFAEVSKGIDMALERSRGLER